METTKQHLSLGATSKLGLWLIVFTFLMLGLQAQTATEPAAGNGSSGNPYQIATLNNLFWIATHNDVFNSYFIQTADIDASDSANWNGQPDWGLGWKIIGGIYDQYSFYTFTGNYNGQGHTVSNISLLSMGQFHGMFGDIDGATISNLNLTNVHIEGDWCTGGLVGRSTNSTICNCSTSGFVRSYDDSGGLVGRARGGSITNSSSSCEVISFNDYAGGFVGNLGSCTITNCSSSGSSRGHVGIGGLLGYADNSTISSSYSTASINGSKYVGGLCGAMAGCILNNCYSRGNVFGHFNLGGFVGIALDYYISSFYNCYSTGEVAPSATDRSGFIGLQYNYNVDACFWDTQSSGCSNSYGGTGKTTAQMKDISTFTNAGWGFLGMGGTVWAINPSYNDGYPFLARQGFPQPSIVSTGLASDILTTGATLNGSIVNYGSPGINHYGFCWSTSPHPDIAGLHSDLGASSSLGDFSTPITGLVHFTKYYVRAYATTSVQTSYGEEESFITPYAGQGTAADPYQISTLEELKYLSEHDSLWSSHYIQMADIDAASTSSWNDNSGWLPIGDVSYDFTGSYDGQNHSVSGLSINRGGSDHQGFIGYSSEASLKNLNLLAVDIVGAVGVGALLGHGCNISISNCTGSGLISGYSSVGALVGFIESGTISNCSSSGTVGGAYEITGGLVGDNMASTISGCFSSSSVSGHHWSTGGLVGYNESSSSIEDCYAWGDVSGENGVGGLVGNNTSSNVARSYSKGLVTGTGSNLGGLVGINFDSSVNNSFWDTTSSGQTGNGGGTGKTTAEMKDIATFSSAGWGFLGLGGAVWGINPSHNDAYPFLARQGFPQPCAVSTGTVGNISPTTASVQASIINFGRPNIDHHGFCWGTSPNPVITGLHSDNGSSSALGAFPISLTELASYTSYYIRAYATNGGYTAYGSEAKFTTLPLPAILNTNTATVITSSTVTLNGVLSSFGIPQAIQHGFCWSLNPGPTTADNKTTRGTPSSIGAYSDQITGLLAYCKYYVRSYAASSVRTDYGNQIEFSTLHIPTQLTSQAVTSIYSTDAIANGTIVTLGIPAPTEYGFCWSLATSPTIADTKSVLYNATATGPFSSEITGLNALTSYYLRAYASTAVETYYSDELSFTTISFAGLGTAANPFQISSLEDLKYLSEHNTYWDKHFIQTADIDASATSTWDGGLGWQAIGTQYVEFAGTYNGQDHSLSGLYINRTSPTSNSLGLFGYTLNAQISNLRLLDVSITANNQVGSLVGTNNYSPLWNCYSSGTVSGHSNVGGIVGYNNVSTISSCFNTCSVTGTGTYVGGVAGMDFSRDYSFASISNCANRGSVGGNSGVGGLVGSSDTVISNCYNAGLVTYTGTGNHVGGLFGAWGNGSTQNCYWDMQSSGQLLSGWDGQGIGRSTLEMKMRSLYTNWDFKGETANGVAEIWNIGNSRNDGYPYLSWMFASDPADDPPMVSTQDATEIAWDTATGNANIYPGNAIQHGFCWNTSGTPTTADACTQKGIPLLAGAFTSVLTGLTPLGTYYVRAYVSTAFETLYGEQVSFSTSAQPLIVTTQAVSDISADSALGHGNITLLGTDAPTQHGHCWDTEHSPSITNSKTELGAPTQTGAYSSELTGLSAATTYYVRAYATNSTGTVYGDEVDFGTMSIAPVVSTLAASAIGHFTATLNGNLSVLGVPAPTAHGFCWSFTENPDLEDSVMDLGAATQTGEFSYSAVELQAYTRYYVRAFVTNLNGTVYGSQIDFSTDMLLPALSTQAMENIGSFGALGKGNLSVLGVPTPSQYGHCWSIAPSPTILNSKTELGAATAIGPFQSTLSSLSSHTHYYARAYATNSAGTAYGEEVEFSTLGEYAVVSTQEATELSTNSATLHGTLVSLGVPNPLSYGFCLSSSETPDTGDSVFDLGAASETGAFSFSVTTLTAYSTYYVRAFATNESGTTYGEQRSFGTLMKLPALTTLATTQIGSTTATGNATFTDLGAPLPTQYGHCWSTAANPDTDDSKTTFTVLPVDGIYASELSELAINTVYYIRAYATNLAGTVYGEQVEFTTLGVVPTLSTQEATLLTASTALLHAELSSPGAPNPTAHGFCWSNSPLPDLEDACINLGGISAPGEFSHSLEGLLPGSTYYVRAYATNLAGTVFGNQISFSTLSFDGSGTAEDPYLIRTLADLKYLGEHNAYWSNHFEQIADIDASATNAWLNGGWKPIGSSDYNFTGSYNGTGHSIEGLSINRTNSVNQGLFGYTGGATIANLKLSNVSILGGNHVGAFIGDGHASTLSNCSSSGSINGESTVGGIIGYSYMSTLDLCASSCSMIGRDDQIGGLAGNIQNANERLCISNSYFAGNIAGVNRVGGLAGSISDSDISNSYSTGQLSESGAENTIGGLIGMATYYNSLSNCFWDVEASGQSTSGAGTQGTGLTSLQMKIKAPYLLAGWDFKGETVNGSAEIWNLGNGRNNGYPYLDWQYSDDPVDNAPILSTQAVSDISFESATGNGTILYAGNASQHGLCWNTSGNPTILESNTTGGTPQIGPFTGLLTGLLRETLYYVRAYATSDLGTVYGNQLTFETLGSTPVLPSVSTQAVTDIEAYTAIGNATIINLGWPNPTEYGVCWSLAPEPTITDGKAILTDATSTGSYTCTITRLVASSVYYLRAYATNTAGTAYGSEVSFSTGVLDGSGTESNPYQISSLADLRYVSEHSNLWSKHYLQMTDIDASPTVSWNSNAGWSPIGNSSPQFTGSYNGQNHMISGLSINRASSNYQGFIGYSSGATVKNLNLVNVSVVGNSQMGALVGYNPGTTISNCSSSGSVSGNAGEVGGLVGQNSGTITNCFSSCSVIGRAWSTGGLVGFNSGAAIDNSYSRGSVNGTDGVGGLVGNNTSSSINKSYSTGSVVGNGSYIGGLVGGNWGSSANCFWDIQTSGKPASEGGTGQTTAQMHARDTFTNASWDFQGESVNGTTDIWNIASAKNDGYPYLAWQYPADPALVSTQAVADITCESATANGTILYLGDASEHGFCWSTAENPTISDYMSTSGVPQLGTFTGSLSGLMPETLYYVRAYASSDWGTVYADQVSFETLEAPLMVTTQAVTDITAMSGIAHGTIVFLGSPSPSEHGFCWNTSPNPTIVNTSIELGAAFVTGSFSSSLNGLSAYTTYYLKAFATNESGTSYGEELSFETLPKTAVVQTLAPVDITVSSASIDGIITDLGAPNPAQHGHCWSTEPLPTVSNERTIVSLTNSGGKSRASRTSSKTELGGVIATGSFSSSITGLNPYTGYYVRAYVTNLAGTVYSEQLEFTTLPLLATLSTEAITDIAVTTATGQGNITVLGSPNPAQHGLCWSTIAMPTITDSHTEKGEANATGIFSSELTGLTPYTLYYVRAYASTAGTTVYGNELSFTTLPLLATLSTQDIEEITATSAVIHANISSLGIPSPTQHGLCWSTEPITTDRAALSLAGSHDKGQASRISYKTELGVPQLGFFTDSLSGLLPETLYYVRAYASSDLGIAYGNQLEFTTLASFDYPEGVEITTGDVSITILGGDADILPDFVFAEVPNPGFETRFSFALELYGSGPWTINVTSPDTWVACLFGSTWLVQEVPQTGENAWHVSFYLEGAKSGQVQLFSGNGGDPTLPVELSSFTAVMNVHHQAEIFWVTQSETELRGYYLYRNNVKDLITALLICDLIPATNSSEEVRYLYTDNKISELGTYYYWLQAANLNNSESFYGPVTMLYEAEPELIPELIAVTSIKNIYPNPFNPSTTISYTLAAACELRFAIYNSRGQQVWQMNLGNKNPGDYTIIWDGNGDGGRAVSTGIYYIRMSAGGESFSRKIVMMK